MGYNLQPPMSEYRLASEYEYAALMHRHGASARIHGGLKMSESDRRMICFSCNGMYYINDKLAALGTHGDAP